MKKYPMVLMESVQRGKDIYRDATSIDDMIACLGDQIAYLEMVQELGVKLNLDDGGVEQDYPTLSVEVREGSEEFKTLEKDYGFTKIKFDEEGERYE